jgi:hypothetical protein
MKLRMKDNSIRLRLTRGELSRLAENGIVEENIKFGTDFGGDFTFTVRLDPVGTCVSATVKPGTISVSLPNSLAFVWIDTEQISIEADQNIEGEEVLQLVIEKDFACLKPRSGEDGGDYFPHPLGGKEC